MTRAEAEDYDDPVRWLLVVTSFAILAGCVTSRHANECPESASRMCLTRRVCHTDTKRGCQVCYCESYSEEPPPPLDSPDYH